MAEQTKHIKLNKRARKGFKAAAIFLGLLFLLIFSLANFLFHNPLNLRSMFILAAIGFSIFLSCLGLFALVWMAYAWENPREVKNQRPPKKFSKPELSFTAIIPARHEEKVIYDTIKSVAAINYPKQLTEVLVVCRSDDYGTIKQAHRAIRELDDPTVSLVIFDGQPINKPHGLNIGLRAADKDLVVVFDAEDEPHRNIYRIVNTVMLREGADVVQSGVQLMNFQKPWFAMLNVLEYYLWYKSALHFFSRFGALTLGGNTVFFKRQWLLKFGGWDEEALTEDADIGVRMSLAGAKIRVVYDAEHATREETPPDVSSFIRQRTRWDHGFMQVIAKRDWAKMPNRTQRVLLLYILGWPLLQTIFVFVGPIMLVVGLMLELPTYVSLLMNVPLIFLLLQIFVLTMAFREFTREYSLPYSKTSPLKILALYFPFQLLLFFGAARAVARALVSNKEWEKTVHVGAHRKELYEPKRLNSAYAKFSHKQA